MDSGVLAVAFLSNRAYALTDKSRNTLRLFEAPNQRKRANKSFSTGALRL